MKSESEKMHNCPLCKDTGFIIVLRDGVEYSRKCECQELKKAKERIECSGLAKEFREKTFANYFTGSNQILTDAKITVERYAEDFQNIRDRKHNSLMLCGQVGAGKTHLGTACSMKLLQEGTAVIYMGYREVMTALKTSIIDSEYYSREINRYKKAQVLFIDDFLKGRITEADINVMYEIINYRYNNNLPLIISTEKTLEELINFDEAISSRMIEMCRGHIIVFEGKKLNYRLYGGLLNGGL